ncbi:hypothetical protein ONE63_007622 [Megalurothrips usitatus]|uniref:Uncharacterized protein n=1 Tax=Megalurothrips usitatus TaxID=439358 RepID=A0AAV7XPC2_9NEOP|nr:hypothetical protein ONE63_007622 [Megalurothrips usitatus]
MPPPPARKKPGLPDGFKSFAEYNAARKEKNHLKQEYFLAKIEKQKQKKERKQKKKAPKVCAEPSTLSIAVPGSILDNAPSLELRTYLAGQIARAACVFKVDEIIVYDDVGIRDNTTAKTEVCLSDSGETRPTRKCCAQLARILQFLECPQYLRKDFFPFHRDLDYAGLLNPLDAPHHMRQDDDCRFREGVIHAQPAHNGSWAEVGLRQRVKLDIPLKPGIRVTVEMLPNCPEAKHPRGRVVSPKLPQIETGIYWGYSVRIANSLNAVFTECPFKEGYDVSIGTSERGEPVETASLPSHQHVLVVFGGLEGLEGAVESDDVLNVDDPKVLFDYYLNTCPDQGSRTIRTEEAILISLAELRTKLKPKVPVRALSKEIETDQNEVTSEGLESAHQSSEEGDQSETNVSGSREIGDDAPAPVETEIENGSASSETKSKLGKRSRKGTSFCEDGESSDPKKEKLNPVLDVSEGSTADYSNIKLKKKKKKKIKEGKTDNGIK